MGKAKDIAESHLIDLDNEIKKARRGLSKRHKKFIDGLIIHNWNQTEAAKHAGFSDIRARNQGSKLATHTAIKPAIDLEYRKDIITNGVPIGFKRDTLLFIITANKVKSPTIAIKAVQELNRMDGHHKAIQMDITNKTTVAIEYKLELPQRTDLEGEFEEVKD